MAKKKKSFKKMVDRILNGNLPPILKNKYFLCSVAFVAWLAFFDRNDIISQVKLRMHLREMESKEQYYSDMIKQVDQEKKDLFTSNSSLEKFAREHYMMKKDEEDLFVFVPAEDKK